VVCCAGGGIKAAGGDLLHREGLVALHCMGLPRVC